MSKKYLAGTEVYWDDKEFVEAFLLTHGVDKKGFDFFQKVQGGLELHLEGNKLIRCYKYFEGEKELDAELVDLPISSWEEHKVFFLEKSNKGLHKLGGTVPEGLTLPAHEKLKTPFQYLGTIDCADKYFRWLPMPKFHIIYPVYECNSGVFLDYANPNEPKIIEPITFDPSWYEAGMEKIDATFVETRLATSERWNPEKFENSSQLLCGVPLWLQAPEIPRNPLTGKAMKFVCTIASDSEIKVANYESNRDYIRDNYLIFADMGNLYVFFDPETKIAHVQIQF
ncbi:MAG: hypothetical protein PHR43_06030 [Dehalococcoidales bacterium]|nr:hypothetical protein [Dehalococcoidales bacterium]